MTDIKRSKVEHFMGIREGNLYNIEGAIVRGGRAHKNTPDLDREYDHHRRLKTIRKRVRTYAQN